MATSAAYGSARCRLSFASVRHILCKSRARSFDILPTDPGPTKLLSADVGSLVGQGHDLLSQYEMTRQPEYMLARKQPRAYWGRLAAVRFASVSSSSRGCMMTDSRVERSRPRWDAWSWPGRAKAWGRARWPSQGHGQVVACGQEAGCPRRSRRVRATTSEVIVWRRRGFIHDCRRCRSRWRGTAGCQQVSMTKHDAAASMTRHGAGGACRG